MFRGNSANSNANTPSAREIVATIEAVTSGVENFKERLDALEGHVRASNERFTLSTRHGGAGDGVSPAAQKEFNAALRGQFNAMSTDSNTDGGYLVPDEIDRAISRFQSLYSPMRRLARVVTARGHYSKPHITDGVTSGWTTERGSRPETAGFKISMTSPPVGEVYANVPVTQQLLDDNDFNIGSVVEEEIATEFSEKEGDAWINGNSVDKPAGILSYPTVANASWAWGKLGFTVTGHATAFASSNPADPLIDLFYSLRAGYRSNSVWLMNSDTANRLNKLKDGQGNYLWQPSIAAGAPPSLLGRPVEIDDNMPAMGANTFPVAIGDWNRGYSIVDKTRTRILRDPYSSKPYVLFYATKRVGGAVMDFDAIKLLKCST